MTQAHKNKHDRDNEPEQKLNIFQLRPPTFFQNQNRKAAQARSPEREEEEERLTHQTSAAPSAGQLEGLGAVEQDTLDLSAVEISEENPERKVLHMFRSRNLGAKEFDDFARGIQTWLSTLEVEAIKRFHDLHIGPVLEACEEYIQRAAQSLEDLIMKALLLCRLKTARRAAKEVARIALQAIENMLEQLDKAVPRELLFTWLAAQEFAEAEAV